MKIIDRYVAFVFLRPLGIGLAVFTLLVTVGHLFDKINTFSNYHASLRNIARYLLFGLPYWIDLVAPVATLLAGLFSISLLREQGEIIGFRASGISSFRLTWPLYGIGMALSIVSFVAGQSIVPHWNLKARHVYRVDIKKQLFWQHQRDRVVVAGQERRRYTINWMDAEAGYLRGVVIDRFGPDYEQVDQVLAREAHYQEGRWILLDGTVREFLPGRKGVAREEPFQERRMTLPEEPADLLPNSLEMGDLNLWEIGARIRALRRLGFPAEREEVAWHLKWALPLTHLIVISLGVPFSLRQSRVGRMKSFTYALLFAFAYWGMTSVGQSLAEARVIAPWLGAWTANLVFAAIGLLLMTRVPT